MLAELYDQLWIINRPADDPDANRIEWLWRRSRWEVTHNHQRDILAALLENGHVHLQTLEQQPALILWYLSNPLVNSWSPVQPLPCAT